jgi:nicastrin
LCRVSNDPELYRKIAGVLVEANGVDNMLGLWICFFYVFYCLLIPKIMYCSDFVEFSPDRKFPQQAFAPYSNLSHHWNPTVSYAVD